MAKSTDGKRVAATSTAAALAAAMLAAPGLAAPAPAPVPQTKPGASPETPERTGPEVKHASKANALNFEEIKTAYKHKGEYSIAGVGDGHIVFEDERGNLFYIDEATGDQKSVAKGKVFPKVEISRRAGSSSKHSDKVSIIGVDAEGKVIMKNARGEKFYLDAATGDMIFADTLLLEAGR